MKVSLLQPRIIRGDIEYNLNRIQSLVEKSVGDVLVLPEYALTGSLVLDNEANVQSWANKSEIVIKELKIPKNKILIINYLKIIQNNLYNICELLPLKMHQIKVFPDITEQNSGILAGKDHELFRFYDKQFKIMICMDFKFADKISLNDCDFFIWIYHFTKKNYAKMLDLMRNFVKGKNKPLLASSLVSDKNIGFSTYIDNEKTISLSCYEGILEIEI